MVKKIKKKRRFPCKGTRGEHLKEKILKSFDRITGNPDIIFQTVVKSISAIFQKYSIQDIAISLFASHLWLPNISSQIKHQFLLSVFVSMNTSNFSTNNKIISYNDFKMLMEDIYPIIPSFPLLEDYVPEPDWGEIKFYHGEKIYKIFYGQELSNVYDYLIQFQTIYEPFDKEYLRHSGRSPSIELRHFLEIQNDIISYIITQPSGDTLSEVSPGHIEVPSKEFWQNVTDLYAKYDLSSKYDKTFLKCFSIQVGDWPREYLKFEIFNELVFNGKVVPKCFLHHNSRYFLLLPRRYFSILYTSWSKVYRDYHMKIVKNDMPYSYHIGKELYHYIKSRIKSEYLFPFVSAVLSDGSPHKVIFSTSLISKDRLILFYVANPIFSKEITEKELTDIAPKLIEAIKLLSESPVKLALHLERKNVQISSKTDKVLKSELFVVIPEVCIDLLVISVPRSLPGNVIFMDQLLGIIDELDDEEMLSSFIEYREENDKRIKSSLAGPLDVFGSFKSSYGVLIEGARNPDFIMLDPHWGTRLRYETLLEFWRLYPEVNFFDHPRSWKVSRETECRIRLESRGYFGWAIYCKVDITHVFLTSPFYKMSFEQGQLANLLMESLDDSISNFNNILKECLFIKYFNQIQIFMFPLSLVKKDDALQHLRHLIDEDKYWSSDIGLVERTRYGIRVVFNDKLLPEAFLNSRDRSLEIDLLIEVLAKLNSIASDPKFELLKNRIESEKMNKPRFKYFIRKMEASFPQFIGTYEPKQVHFKKARKKIAELAQACGVSAGHYNLEEAKNKLNALRDVLIQEINSEVQKYDYHSSILFLISRIDALTDEYERKIQTIKVSIDQEVDYSREGDYAEQQLKYLTMHRCNRYLIEKYVQLIPMGKIILDREQFQYLIALIDELYAFYRASDVLHYGISPIGMSVSEDFLVNIESKYDWETKEKYYSEEGAMLSLGLMGDPEDRISSPRSVDEYLDALDTAFKQDLGFSIRNMINVLQIMARWGYYSLGTALTPYYSATIDEIEGICTRDIKGFISKEINPIIDFLTLKKEDILHLIGQEQPCSDIPVWEHRKRFARYSLRPLILIEGKYYWGSWSVLKTAEMWISNISNGTLPADLQCPNVDKVVRSEKKHIEEAIEDKAFEIVSRFTSYVRKNCELYKLDSSHPSGLGDFDVVAFLHKKNVILNIECKDILPVYCLKDLKSLRDKIFGIPGKDGGHFKKIGERQRYLLDNLIPVTKTLKWPINSRNLPRIDTVYLTRARYWWTRFPPRKVDALFLRIDMLSKYIEDL